MSVSGILSSAVFSLGAHLLQNRTQKMHSEFQQLGQDLQSGNLQAAQADFATLQQLQPQSSSKPSTPGTTTITQDFSQLAADLKAGNLTAAQKDFTTLQKDLQTQPPTVHHRRHHGSDSGGSGTMGQLFSQLGQALQSGNLSTAQQAYAALQQDFQPLAKLNVLPAQPSVSLNA
jgi:hypothetical protein